VSLDQLRSVLHDSGVSLATINFAGAMTCTVTRSDATFDENAALAAWARGDDPTIAGDGAAVQPAIAVDAVTRQQQRLRAAAQPSDGQAAFVDDGSLKAALVVDLAARLHLPAESLQMDFRADDRGTLGLRSPQFQFQIQPFKPRADLGEQRWIVSITSGASTRKAQIVASARAWQDQVIVTRPIGFKQSIAGDSVDVRRVLVDRINTDPLVPIEVVIGSAASRELPAGTVVTSRLITPVELARPGQLVTVVMRRGGIEVRTVATALQAGSYGQLIRVKFEKSREQIDVRLTGPQFAELGDTDARSASAN
jgi:flagella basal body P-ring formation protein FlgA